MIWPSQRIFFHVQPLLLISECWLFDEPSYQYEVEVLYLYAIMVMVVGGVASCGDCAVVDEGEQTGAVMKAGFGSRASVCVLTVNL